MGRVSRPYLRVDSAEYYIYFIYLTLAYLLTSLDRHATRKLLSFPHDSFMILVGLWPLAACNSQFSLSPYIGRLPPPASSGSG